MGEFEIFLGGVEIVLGVGWFLLRNFKRGGEKFLEVKVEKYVWIEIFSGQVEANVLQNATFLKKKFGGPRP